MARSRMNDNEDSARAPSPLRRRVFGSALSAFVGWITLTVILIGGTIYEGAQGMIASSGGHYEWDGCAIMSVVALGFVLVTWLLLTAALASIVPLRSVLWHWPFCTVCGALAGAGIMFVYCRPFVQDGSALSLIILASITGASTCLFGSSSIPFSSCCN